MDRLLQTIYPLFLNNIFHLKNRTWLLRFLNNNVILSIIKIVLWLYDFLKARKSFSEVDYEIVSNFDIWVDNIWNQVKNDYEFIAERNLDSLNLLYPKNEKKYIKIKVYNGSKEAIGWCVVLKTKMTKHKQFGNMYLGSIVDCLCSGNYEDLVISAGLKYLNDNQVDLIVSNILLALGMFMLSPALVSLPFKILLFVLADGWNLLTQGLLLSFQ